MSSPAGIRKTGLLLFILFCTGYIIIVGYLGNQLAVKVAGRNTSEIGIPFHEHQGTAFLAGALAFPVLSLPLLLFRKQFGGWMKRSPLPIMAGIFAVLCFPYYFALWWQFG